MALHSYNSEYAHYGYTEAVLIQHFLFWIKKNKERKINEHDDHTWTYSSVVNLQKIYKYLTPRRIQLALERLISKGILLKGRYNKIGYDRTNWYSFADEEMFLCQPAELEVNAPIQRGRLMDSTPALNRSNTDVEPIPYSYTDISTDEYANPANNKIITIKKPPATPTESIGERRCSFKDEIDKFRFKNRNLYPVEVYTRFYDHWTASQNGVTMRFEEKIKFVIEQRLEYFWNTISEKDRAKYWDANNDWMLYWKLQNEKKSVKAIIHHASRSTQPELFKQQRYTS